MNLTCPKCRRVLAQVNPGDLLEPGDRVECLMCDHVFNFRPATTLAPQAGHGLGSVAIAGDVRESAACPVAAGI
jgi:hypothetical protein